jgi:hypothetical protein
VQARGVVDVGETLVGIDQPRFCDAHGEVVGEDEFSALESVLG